MKFMIVDDEPIVREGLKTLIDWSAMGFDLCDEASDGNEAVSKIMDNNPDLVILDIKIPELTGVEVAETIREKGFNGKIIILSGFSDFSYAQNAIRYGAEAYLLKPVDEKELIAALERVRDKIEQENILELYNNQKHTDAKNMLLKHILTGTIRCDLENFHSYGVSLNISPFQLVMIDYSQFSDIDINHKSAYWRNLYPDSKSEFVAIENSIMVLINGLPSIQYFANHILDYMNKGAEEHNQTPFVIVSDTFDEVSSFPIMYQKLKGLSRRRFFYYEGSKPIFCREVECKKEILHSDKLDPVECIDTIYKAIINKDNLLIDGTINKLYGVLQNRNFTIEQTYQVLINCILQLKALLNETYIKELIDFNENILIKEICNCKSLFEIVGLLKDTFTRFCDDIKKSSEVSIIDKVLNYMDIHYNEELKLEKVAELFGYNNAYLGRLLSNRIGTNFNFYIEKKRMEKAMDMLTNTDIKIPDISILIGYQNVEYFYRKFKKYTKLTPGNYRAYHRIQDKENPQ